MKCLNQDDLFSIGKELIENGDSDSVYRFALSGKGPFEAMKRVFSNVTTLELCWDHYVIGWGIKCSKFEFNKPNSKFLLHLIGNCVTKLHVGCYNPIYDPIIDKIVSRKQLNTFATAGPFCGTSFLDKLLPTVSSSLQNVIIPSSKMTPTFRDALNLKSLTVLGEDGYDFALFCCKTSSLEFSYRTEKDFLRSDDFQSTWQDFFNYIDLSHIIPESLSIGPLSASIKKLTVNVEFVHLSNNGWMKMMKHFPSLESLKFNVTLQRRGKDYRAEHIEDLVDYDYILDSIVEDSMYSIIDFPNNVTHSMKVPPKVVFSFSKFDRTIYDLRFYQSLCEEYDYHETNSDFYCFRRTISTVGPRPILFEIQFT